MGYADSEAFLLRVGEIDTSELTDRDNTGEINYEILEVALADSSSQIDGYLTARYRLPLPTPSPNLTRLCCDLARYRLASMSKTTITDEIIERYKLSLKELENISRGVIALDVDYPEDDALSKDEIGVQFANVHKRVFSR